MVTYKDPWADAANQAVGALYKYYLSKPNPADLERAAMQNELLGLQMEGQRAGIAKNQFELDQARRQSQFADKFSNAFSTIPEVRGAVPTDGSMGPVQPVTQEDRNMRIANLFEQFAPRLDKDTVAAARDALGTASAMRFEDPVQRQLAIDEKATSYENMMDPREMPYTLSPGSVRFNADNQQVASAPFKQGGGSYITQPDGTVISIDGGMPPEMTTAVTTDLQTKDLAFDTYRTFSQKMRNDIIANPGGVGTRGNIARIADGLLGQVNSFAPNSKLGQELKSIVDATAGQYTDPVTGKIMNKDLYAAASTAALLPFVASEAIVGQGGRSLSNEDRDLVFNAVGSPEDWLATPDKLIARLDNVDAIVNELRPKYQKRLLGDRPLTPDPDKDEFMRNQNITPDMIDNMSEEELDAFLSEQ